MKGDFTRYTFKRENHYSSVRMQQGRVQLDADWNEQLDIEAHLEQTTTRDFIGPCGAPMHEAGFSVQPQAGSLLIGAGHYYVDGIFCENDNDVLFTEQPDLPGATLPPEEGPGLYLAYLDVWQHHITTIEDPEIREVALGGPDTATRTKTVWQAKLFRVGDVGISANCLSDFGDWNSHIAASSGRLRARAQPGETSDDPCIVPPGAGFRRLENQLYRVEIHKKGLLDEASFKWSRENGSIVTRWLDKNGDDLIVSSLGRDKVLGFASGQWVELTDDGRELRGEPGTLVKLVKAEGQVLTIDPTTATGSVNLADFHENPRVRRWDMLHSEITVEVPAANDGYIALEDGVEVKFEPGSYRTGDYWLIPARTATGDVEWPRDASNDPQPQLPHGIYHHYCRLALLNFDGSTWTAVSNGDCRHLFPPVTELTSMFYVSGDGQEVMPDLTQPNQLLPLPQPLKVGVANGRWPVEGAKVRFIVKVGNGNVTPVDVVTGVDGIASCTWSLDDTTQSQQVEASLLDAAENPIHMPILFTANLSVASQVAYDPATCSTLQNRKTVQDAIDQLSQLSNLFYVSGDGQEARPGEALPQLLRVQVVNKCRAVTGARVRFVAQGNGRVAEDKAGLSAATSNTIEVTTGTDGIASCAWRLDPNVSNPSQQLEATLLAAAGNPIHVPNVIRFTANLSVASQVAYDPKDCPSLIGKETVQEAIDQLCQTGEREPGIHIIDVRTLVPNVPLRNDTEVPVSVLAAGLQVVFDSEVDRRAIRGKPICFVTLDMPFPFNNEDRKLWGDPVIGFQPLILDAKVNSDGKVIFWQPTEQAATWLQETLFPRLKNLNRGERVLAHLTLKGDFIWAEKDPQLYLDGEVFGVRNEATNTDLDLPSGDGRRGGDFEMWFYLVDVSARGPTPPRPPVEPPVRPVEPPVRPPIEPPVRPPEPPIRPPVEPPVRPPIEPPVRPPVEPPVRPPIEPPVRPPVEPPIRPPVEPPVRPPIEPPVRPPVGPVGAGIPIGPGGVTSSSLISPPKVPEGEKRGEASLEAVDGVKTALAKNLIAAGFRDVEALFQVIDEAKKLLEQA